MSATPALPPRSVWIAAAAFALACATALAETPERTLSGNEAAMLANGCANCHGVSGVRERGAIPSLAGLPEGYLATTLTAFRDGSRPGSIMNRAMEGYSDARIQALAQYYASLPQETVPDANDRASPGQHLYQQACATCHELAQVPPLKGQPVDYLRNVIADVANGRRAVPTDMTLALSRLEPPALAQLLDYLDHCRTRETR